MRVVVASDKFKGCLTAEQVAAALGAGISEVRPAAEVVAFPVADGGDGTVAAALSAGFAAVPVTSTGPTGAPVEAVYAVQSGDAGTADSAASRAVIELAGVVGLDLLPGQVPDPLGSTTYGLGVMLRDAIDRGATEIVLGLGGSASTDGGAGLLQALGARLLDAAGKDLPPGGAALADLASLDLAPLRATVGSVAFTVASDVDNPLLGPTGAAAIFGPQKGATPDQVLQLDAALARFADVVAAATGEDHRDRSGAGAAGGTGFGALALLGAQIRPGIELILELLDFDRVLAGADLVITGEGSLDEQSLAGKAPVGVADAAGRAGVDVIAVAGRSLLSQERLQSAGIQRAYPLSALEPDVTRSIANAADLLHQVGRTIATDWLPVP